MNVLWAPKGSGKSTLIKMLLGIVKPDRGAVWLDRRLKLGVVLEDHVALKSTPLTQLLEYGAAIKGGIVEPSVVELLGLESELGKSVGELSSGNARKALIAQALTGTPELLILDEPLANLDPASRIAVSTALNELRDKGVSLVIATHILSLLQPDYVYTIANGKILGPYTPRKTRRVYAINPETGEEEEIPVNEARRVYYKGWIIVDS